MERFTESISFDHRLYAHDIAGSIAHAQMLAKVGLISADESRQIEAALLDIRREIEEGRFEFDVRLEDIHMHIEQASDRTAGRRGPQTAHRPQPQRSGVHGSASLGPRCDRPGGSCASWNCSGPSSAGATGTPDVILPAYTHLQRAQPVLAPHYWLAYCEKFERDRQRLADCRKRVNVCSLGSGRGGRHQPADRPRRRGPAVWVSRRWRPTAWTFPVTGISCWSRRSRWP